MCLAVFGVLWGCELKLVMSYPHNGIPIWKLNNLAVNYVTLATDRVPFFLHVPFPIGQVWPKGQICKWSTDICWYVYWCRWWLNFDGDWYPLSQNTWFRQWICIKDVNLKPFSNKQLVLDCVSLIMWWAIPVVLFCGHWLGGKNILSFVAKQVELCRV